MQNVKKIKIALWVFWLLLFYIIAALIWWYISLERQNKQLYTNKLQTQYVSQPHPIEPDIKAELLSQKSRNTTKHIAEGITFLAIILFGAFYIYRIVKNQIKAIDQQNNFIMAVTHELKTPIAIAQLNIETLQKRQIEPLVTQRLLSNTLKELYRLNDLASNILVVSQIEKDGYSLKLEDTNLSSLVKTTVEEINNQNNNRVQTIQLEENIITLGDPLLLKLVITNIIDNALKYSNTDSAVFIALKTVNQKIEFTVSDLGDGIADKDKEKVFEKFYRQGNEITRTKKGTGLGLYLCKKIVQDHKGTIAILNNEPQGSIFKVSIG